ncbi:squalene--hopene cyclase [Cylindrospermopsis raciborskii S07]|uniref:Squalene--hopene cyclase n=1 Tax=Cylindrospermopsis raciborskii C07 TaxID=2014886 RepID=A0ABX4WKD2_9CYAN|nr:squalene--hopene cyclase [Cylindrospermopsis raciborskii]PNJ92420.1 squalene--hopene cyclase [Cylindrospermopsis raciborskii C07]PNJ94122.1 squalene--hopene cyclase [Cylindrospermopsis raciborskii C04]PNJ96769.1 squalene--hopene cyclase [Cylindrospermopsis raciborskii C03]PNK08245.1 squalene--hopene cyclase [Cylindrospermopsis raciborskii S10]PNK09982.1 squalene--hopene cyclase [Cylindrospermopsis raciborskii S14]
MQTQPRTNIKEITQAIAASQEHLLSIQRPEGYWWGELESNVTITVEVLLLHKIWGTCENRALYKIENYLRCQQREHGGWELYYGDGGDLSTSVEAYMGLRLLGVPATDTALVKAKSWILKKGGISKTRIFTKLHLALIGCYNWRGLPSLPPWVMLLPDYFPFNIYELSSWARSSTVPLLIVFNQKPVFDIDSPISLDELYAEGIDNAQWALPKNNDWSDIFTLLDDGFKLAESLNLVPLRDQGIKAAEKWILERQESTGDWGGIIPAMLNSLLALKCLNYKVDDPIIYRGLKAVDNFVIETDNSYCVQPCVSPVWDTAWAIRSLIDSGMAPDDPVIVKAGEWLIDKQIIDYGDWGVKNKQGQPGAWAFEFDNRFYPDVDDSAVVVMALHQAKLPNENLKKQAIKRAVNWIISMQCKSGGWAAFDIDNDQEWLNYIPYGDLKAMIDPNTADVTARVIEMLGVCKLPSQKLDQAMNYLLGEQETEGCWFGRWGVNYIYGTSGVLSALALINPRKYLSNIEKGASWLKQVQNPDGGWGETCLSYRDPNFKGKGDSTPSQTAWGLMGLIAAGEAKQKFDLATMEKAVNYLLTTQRLDGTWDESYFTGTGFPGHFYLKYHLYQQYFPLLALGRYRRIVNSTWP